MNSNVNAKDADLTERQRVEIFARELAQAIALLPEAEQTKIYYVTEGMRLGLELAPPTDRAAG